jgi:hypothetical protein
MRSVTIAAGILFASSGLAQTSTFNNHLTSTPIVSPAQLYQVEDMKTDFSLGYRSSTETSKPTGATESETTGTDTGLFAGAIYNVKAIGLRTGVTVNYGMSDVTQDNTAAGGTKTEIEGTETILTPQLAYPVGPVVVGAAIDVVQRSAKVEDAKERKSTHNRFRPGVLFANQSLEAGLTYTSPNRVTAEDAEKDLDVMEAAVVKAHGRFAIDTNMKAGAILANTNHKALDKDLYKDQTAVTGTFEYGLSATQIEAELGYKTAFYKDKNTALSDETIATMTLGAAADYELNPTASVGGGFGYEFGSDKNDSVEVAKNELTVAVRGNMKF